MPYSTPTDVTNILNLAFTSSTVPTTAQVTDLILRADSYVDRVSNHNWYTNQSQETYDAIGTGPRAGTIILRNRPLLSIIEVDWWYAGPQVWMPGFQGFPEQTVGLLVGPVGNQQQPQSYLVYYPEGKIVWNTLRLDHRLYYRVTYTWGYTSVPDFIRDLSSCVAARDVVMFWGSQLGLAENISMFKKRLDERIVRLESRAVRPAAYVG